MPLRKRSDRVCGVGARWAWSCRSLGWTARTTRCCCCCCCRGLASAWSWAPRPGMARMGTGPDGDWPAWGLARMGTGPHGDWARRFLLAEAIPCVYGDCECVASAFLSCGPLSLPLPLSSSLSLGLLGCLMHWPDIVVCGQCSCVCVGGGGSVGTRGVMPFFRWWLQRALWRPVRVCCIVWSCRFMFMWLHTTELQAFDLRLRRAPLLVLWLDVCCKKKGQLFHNGRNGRAKRGCLDFGALGALKGVQSADCSRFPKKLG